MDKASMSAIFQGYASIKQRTGGIFSPSTLVPDKTWGLDSKLQVIALEGNHAERISPCEHP
jgi:hypothetical protein